jgi:hypothetical protein
VSAFDHWLPYGEAPDGRLINVREVPSGLACGLICPECRQRLVAKKGEIVCHHFAHEAESSCSGGAETTLHKLAKQIISDNKLIVIPALVVNFIGITGEVRLSENVFDKHQIRLDSVDLEIWMDGIRPDVVAKHGERELAIEIMVTHACEEPKIDIIRSRQINCIEIDMSDVRGVDAATDPDYIADMVTWKAPRKWLFNSAAGPVMDRLRDRVSELDRIAVLERTKREALQKAQVLESFHEYGKRMAKFSAKETMPNVIESHSHVPHMETPEERIARLKAEAAIWDGWIRRQQKVLGLRK